MSLMNIRKKQVFSRIPALIIPICSHLSAVAAIGTLWFQRGGEFHFNTTSSIDYLIAIAVLLILINGFLVIFKEAMPGHEITLDSDELKEYIADIRLRAEKSIDIFGGDLSWLSSDYGNLENVIKKGIVVRIYFNKSTPDKDTIKLLGKLHEIGAHLFPYSDNKKWRVKFTLVDAESDEAKSLKLYAYERIDKSGLLSPAGHKQFRFREYSSTETVLLNAIQYLTELLRRRIDKCMLIGVMGINNLGKTTLCSILEARLKQIGKVTLVKDQFRITNSASETANLAVIISDITNISIAHNSSFVIFDRTILDNFLCMHLRKRLPDAGYANLATRIQYLLSYFTRIYWLRPAYPLSADTRKLTARQRQKLGGMYEEFLNHYKIEHTPLVCKLECNDEQTKGFADQIEADILTHWRTSSLFDLNILEAKPIKPNK